MDIVKGSWPHWLFGFAMEIWNQFLFEEYATRRYEKRTNLCHLVRMTCVYAPVAILVNLATWAAAIATLVVLPIHFFGVKGYSASLAAITFLIFAIWGIGKLVAKLEGRRARLAALPTGAVARTGPGFLVIAKEFAIAKKQKICPVINFTKEASHATHS